MSDDKPDSTAASASDVMAGTISITEPPRTENLTPTAYRLAKKSDGTLVLQGAYMWREGWSSHGYEWRDIPTVDL